MEQQLSTPLKRKNSEPVMTAVNPASEFGNVPDQMEQQQQQQLSTPLRVRREQEQEQDPRIPQERMPQENLQTPMNIPVPHGQSQGDSRAERAGPMSGGLKKEFFSSESEYTSAVIVFALLLVLSSGMFYGLFSSRFPSLVYHERPTYLGSVVFAIMGACLYLFIKYMSKKF